jgi:hypothetical protein
MTCSGIEDEAEAAGASRQKWTRGHGGECGELEHHLQQL